MRSQSKKSLINKLCIVCKQTLSPKDYKKGNINLLVIGGGITLKGYPIHTECYDVVKTDLLW